MNRCLLRISGETVDVSVPPVDPVLLNERLGGLQKPRRTAAEHRDTLRRLVGLLDLTSLEGSDTPDGIADLARRAVQPLPGDPTAPPCAAVCVYPSLVPAARNALQGTPVAVASVAGGFPAAQIPLPLQVAEVRAAIDLGAQEIDLVIPRGAFLCGRFQEVADLVQQARAASPGRLLKVILETSELGGPDAIRLASSIALHSGADFLKTSTGKISPGATLPDTLVMLEALRDFQARTGRAAGIKPAGGIRSAAQALAYHDLIEQTLGDAWIHPSRFRLGASSLLDALCAEWISGGRPQAP